MAKRRMFHADVADTNRFLDMSPEAQALYFHMGLRADDDGFFASPKRLCRFLGFGENALDELESNDHIIVFEDGVCVIVEWNVNNYIQNDRHHPTLYTDDLEKVELGDDRLYHLKNISETQACSNRNFFVSNSDTEIREGKNREDKVSIAKGREAEGSAEVDDRIGRQADHDCIDLRNKTQNDFRYPPSQININNKFFKIINRLNDKYRVTLGDMKECEKRDALSLLKNNAEEGLFECCAEYALSRDKPRWNYIIASVRGCTEENNIFSAEEYREYKQNACGGAPAHNNHKANKFCNFEEHTDYADLDEKLMEMMLTT